MRLKKRSFYIVGSWVMVQRLILFWLIDDKDSGKREVHLMKKQVVAATRINQDLNKAIYEALDLSGILGMIRSDSIVALKPNFTYPYHKPGITTSPKVLEQTIEIITADNSRESLLSRPREDMGHGKLPKLSLGMAYTTSKRSMKLKRST